MSVGQYTPDTKTVMLKTTEEINLIQPQLAFSVACGKTALKYEIIWDMLIQESTMSDS